MQRDTKALLAPSASVRLLLLVLGHDVLPSLAADDLPLPRVTIEFLCFTEAARAAFAGADVITMTAAAAAADVRDLVFLAHRGRALRHSCFIGAKA